MPPEQWPDYTLMSVIIKNIDIFDYDLTKLLQALFTKYNPNTLGKQEFSIVTQTGQKFRFLVQ